MPIPVPSPAPLGFVPAGAGLAAANGIVPFVAPAAAAAAAAVGAAAGAAAAGAALGLGLVLLGDLLTPRPAGGPDFTPGGDADPSPWDGLNGPPPGPGPLLTDPATGTPIKGVWKPTGEDEFGPYATGSFILGPIAGNDPGNGANRRAVSGTIYPGGMFWSQPVEVPVYNNQGQIVGTEIRYKCWGFSRPGDDAPATEEALCVPQFPYKPGEFAFVITQVGVNPGDPGVEDWTAGDPAGSDWLGAPKEPPDFPPLPAPAGPAPGGGGLGPAGVSVSGSAIEQPGPAPGARPVPLAPAPTPAYVPAAVPWATPQTRPQTQPQPSQVPGSTPTGTPTIPTPAPGTFPGTDPARPTLPTAPDATVKPPAPAPVPTTPADSIIPWPGARPIPGTGPAPRPDLPGIAQELGRIERKIEQMNTPANPVMGQNGPLDLIGLARAIFEILSALNSGTVYSMDSPCEVDDMGQKKPPVEVEVPGGITPFAAIYARMDALAQLLQVHKNLRQPSCKGVKPTGEWVTVQFEEFFP